MLGLVLSEKLLEEIVAIVSEKGFIDSKKKAILQEKLTTFSNTYTQQYKITQRELKNRDEIIRKFDSIRLQLNKTKSEKDRIIEQQTKMAAMGEMMDAVAHQWKQPLNALSMYTDLLQSDFNDGEVDAQYIQNFSNDIQGQIEHMVSTLSEFRSFFRPTKEVEPFGLKRCIQGVLLLTKDEFLKNAVNVTIESEQEIIINGIENEFKHLILNIINNAKDAFNERNVLQRDIHIRFNKDVNIVTLEIEDNAGGIPNNVIEHIFKPNVTTKEAGKGTGIGLYMSAQIAQKLGGKLSVYNAQEGACFQLVISQE